MPHNINDDINTSANNTVPVSIGTANESITESSMIDRPAIRIDIEHDDTTIHSKRIRDHISAQRLFYRQRSDKHSMILTPNIDLKSDITDEQTNSNTIQLNEYTEQRITRMPLKFKPSSTDTLNNNSLESQFRLDYYNKCRQPVCRMLLLTCVVWALFAIVDVQKNAVGQRKMFGATCVLRGCTCAYGLLSSYALWEKRKTIARFTKSGDRSVKRTDSSSDNNSKTWLKRFIEWSDQLCGSELGMQFFVGSTMLSFGISQIVFGIWQQDDLDPSFSLILILIPSCSSTMLRQRFIYSISFTFILLVLFILLTVATSAYKSESDFALTIAGLVVANILFSIHAYNREYIIRKNYLTNCQLLQEEQRSQRLLDRMLPQSIITKLRTAADDSHENFIYQHYDCVSILFSHIVNFDDYTAKLTPMCVITLLNNLFSQFDQLTDIYKVYKVETIGDVYLIASGCPDEYRRKDHAAVLCVVAIEMKAIIDAMKSGFFIDRNNTNVSIDIRIGINSGAIIAGVVGARYPRYRLMGDSINTASRMSTTCDTGDIQLSTSTYQLLPQNCFTCIDRGAIPIKGKGLMNTYLLKSHQYDDCVDSIASAKMKRYYTRRTYNRLSDPNDVLSTHTSNNVDQIKHTAAELQRTLMQDIENSGDESSILSIRDNISYNDAASLLNTPQQSTHQLNAKHTQNPSTSRQPDQTRSRLTPVFSYNTHVEQLQTDLSPQSLVLHNKTLQTTPLHASLRLHDPVVQIDNTSDIVHSSSDKFTLVSPSYHPRHNSTDSFPSHVPATRNKQAVNMLHSVSHRINSSVSILNKVSTASPSQRASSTSTVVIAAISNDIKVNRVFMLGNVEDVLKPRHRPWTQMFTQRFTNHPQLEIDFQQYYIQKYSANMRRWTSFVVISLLPLALYDTFNQLDIAQSDAIAIWSVRLTGLLCGVIYYICSFHHRYVQHLQLMSSCMLTIAGCVFMYIAGVLDTYYKSYGVAIVLILLSLVAMFVNLQLMYSVVSVTALLTCWLVISGVYGGSIPGIGLMLLAGAVAYIESGYSHEHYVREDYVRYRKQLNEKKRTKQFLENMLPSSVIASMADDRMLLVAHERPHADVFFSDIVSFTSLAAKFSPEDVVAILNVMFNTFDALTHRYGIYKVETIGDAYLACNGVIEQNKPSHTRAMIDFALAVQLAIKYFKSPDKQPIVVRIGIHSGYVIAGVVGKKMPRYHLFGETVTIAEEMEQRGIPGKVCISDSTRLALESNDISLYDLERIDPIKLSNDKMLSRFVVKPSSLHPDNTKQNRRSSRRNTPLDQFIPRRMMLDTVSQRNRSIASTAGKIHPINHKQTYTNDNIIG